MPPKQKHHLLHQKPQCYWCRHVGLHTLFWKESRDGGNRAWGRVVLVAAMFEGSEWLRMHQKKNSVMFHQVLKTLSVLLKH